VELREASQNEASAEIKVPVWQSYGKVALNFFDPLEITLLLCAIACICLFTYYMAT